MKFIQKKYYSAKKYIVFTMTLAALLGSSYPIYAAEAAPVEAAPAETAPAEVVPADSSPQALPSITSFQELSEENAELTFDDKPALPDVAAKLPGTLSVFLDDASAAAELPVTWECSVDYESTDYDTYDFTPKWDTAAYTLSSTLNAATDIPYITVTVNAAKASVYLVNLTEAQSELDTASQSKDILALVYLCDSYEVKQEPGAASAAIASVTSGQSVQITGVGEDNLKNIWYKVAWDAQGTAYSGYIERQFLAYSDEDLINWEKKYINSYLMRSTTAEVRDTYADIKSFPDSYQSILTALKDAHPNWIFVKMETGVDWNTAVMSENSKDRSLISSSVNAAWKKEPFDNNWAYPTDGIVAYYMDPRNFLSENHIFQFELLSYNATYHTQTAVQGILDGTFMSGAIPGDTENRTYTQAFCNIGKTLNVSPFHLASRVRQEQGKGQSALISGSYPGYEGLYNYFNIGATGKGDAEVIANGLQKAREYNWVSRYLSLDGGSNIISKSYIQKGQNTLYLQKYNVDKNSPSGIYNHQYMQNIAAPSSEAVSVKKAYTSAGSVNNPFVFRIPVFDNMPNTPCPKPSSSKEITLNSTSLTLKAEAAATLTASIDGKPISASSVTFASADAKIAAVDVSGTVTAVSSGTTTITCTASGGAAASCVVTVQKIDPLYSVPGLNQVTYSPSGKLSGITLPAGWTWDAPNTVPSVNTTGYPATFTPADVNKYNTIKVTIPLTILKAVPEYTIPAGLQTAAGNSLASIKLPAGFVWESPATVLSKEGTVKCKASYNPDFVNYDTVSGIDISITVTAKVPECTTHTYGEWAPVTTAACTVPGTDVRFCNKCGFRDTRNIAALGHSYTSAVTKESTETETGIRTYTCSACKDTYTETIDKLPVSHKHSYSSKITQEVTCVKKGVKTYTCSCGDAYKEDIAASGHSYSSKITKEPTEKETGIRTYTCSKCNDSYTETINKLTSNHKHSYTSKITKEATCTEKGIKTLSCACGDFYNEDIASPGHSYTSNITKEPSCTEKGIKTYTCSRCSGTYTEEIPATGHNMSNGKCTRCGYTETKNNTGGSTSADNTQANNTQVNNLPPKTDAALNTAPTDTNKKTENKKPADTQTASSNVTIDMKKNTVLYEETLSSVRGEDIDVVLNMGNSICWTINGRNIVADEANGIDMGISVSTGNIPEEILKAVAGGNENNTVIELSLAHDGALDFSPILTINTAKDNAGRMASLFHYSPETKQLEFVDAVEITETGDISFTFSHASDYAVVISDESMQAVAAVPTTDNTETVDAGNTADIENITAEAGAETDVPIDPKTIVIIVVILLVGIAIGAAVFFILRQKDEDSPDDDDEKYDEDEEIKEDNDEDSDDEIDLEYVEEDFIDDYHEPAVNVKKTGKVVSIKKASKSNIISFDNDDFDGFE